MQSIGILFILMTFLACDPYKFGFKKNPAYVLDEAFKAVTNQDLETLLEMTGKEALCIYGNTEGLNYLKQSITLSLENIKLSPKVLEKKYNSVPKFVGYWSYYHERYEIQISEKVSDKLQMSIYVDCEYGNDGEKSDQFQNLYPKKYRFKECRIIKIDPKTFKTLPLAPKCENLKVTL